MDQYGLVFHHLGLAVKRPDAALHFLRGLGYRTGEAVYDPLQNVHLLMAEHPSMPSVEVIYPSAQPGPVDKLLARHKEGLVYHVCYVSRDMGATLRAMEEDGVGVFGVVPAKPAVLFGGRHVSFYLVDGFGLIEVIEERAD